MRPMSWLAAGAAALGSAGDASALQGPELRFEAPPGYAEQRSGDVIVLAPTAAGDQTPCIYGLAAPRRASGDLERDAEAALVEALVPGWRRIDDRHAAMRGTAADGWPYVWYRAAFEGDLGGQRQAVNAMAMALPAGAGQVHVVWGMGSISRCLLDDASFESLFHSLRPTGWKSDGGKALTQTLLGTWRFTASAGLQQLTFKDDGSYERDLGSRATVGVSERTSSTATGGRFELRDGDLVLTPSHRPQSPDRYRVRAYEEWFLGGWKPAIALLDPGASPPLVVAYYRVDDP
jgi:hypothetical protein